MIGDIFVDTLERCGFSQVESRLYMTLLKQGEQTTTEVARASGVKRPTAHFALQNMIMFGFVSESMIGKSRYYSATHPRKLVKFVKSRSNQIEGIYPELQNLYAASSSNIQVQIFNGSDGVKRVYQDIIHNLKDRSELVGLTRIDAFNKHPGSLKELKDLYRKLKKVKVRELNYDNDLGRAWLRDTKNIRSVNHQVRFIADNYVLGKTDFLVYRDRVFLFTLEGKISVTVITNAEISKTMLAIFNLAWDNSNEL